MTTVPIPAWNAHGVLPPVNPDDPTGPDRSPYAVSLTDIVLRFGTSPERNRVLDGWLRYRAALHELGFLRGFQWLDGSFLEEIELLESRPPKDVDVVTFVEPPINFAINTNNQHLFDHDWVKEHHLVDHCFVELNLPGDLLVAQSAYWYGVWSHQRSSLWKGYLQIDLAPDEDETARANLTLEESGRTEP